MGVVQKIFYFHVPSAYAMYLCFGVCGIASLLYLVTGWARWDRWAVAGGEIGLTFCLIVLLTGPLWARKAWGVYWTWDPRLTTTLLAGLIFVAYAVLRSMGGGVSERKFAAAIALFGLIDLPIIHYSVQKWRGQHPTVITKQGGGLDEAMVLPLLMSLGAFTLLAVVLLWTRALLEEAKDELSELEFELTSNEGGGMTAGRRV